MGPKNYLVAVADTKCIDPADNVFGNIWHSYESVVLHSLVTSFGLDFLVQDQHGGDVDSIRSVRSSGFKSDEHRAAYEARGAYDTKAYHTHPQYLEIAQSARKSFNESGVMQQDAYVPGNTVAYSKASALGKERRANLDHVISAHEIHEDPGRVLAGLDGRDLANSPDNLKFTNESLNKQKSDMTVEAFLDKKGDAIPEDVQQQMRAVDQESREKYEAKLAQAYYSSSDFWGDAIAAAGARGIEMGARQALGFIFVEVWFACKEEMLAVPDNGEIKDYYTALERGVKKSLENIIAKRKGLLESFGLGFIAGSLASLTTTICNIFFEIDEKTIRNLRQVYAAVVQAANVLLFNPNDLLLGDRIEAATVILGTGASVLVGTKVGDMIAKTPIGADPTVGTPIRIFCSTLVSGLISCTMLLVIDRSKFINKAITTLNMYLTEDQSFRQIAYDFETYAAQIAAVDVEQFRKDTERFQNIADEIYMADDDEELDSVLTAAFEVLAIPAPWSGDFDEFMGNTNNKLKFG